MSNSPLTKVTMISPNQSGIRTHSIDRISPHCVVGQCTAESLGTLFARSSTKASSNYGIDKDGRVGMYVEENCRSWCTSSNENDQRAVTIECASDAYDPYRMNDAVYATLIELCVDICERNGKTRLLWFGDKNKALSYHPGPDEMVITVHRWFANKSCPGDWLYSRLGQLASEVTRRLQEAEDDDMLSYEEWKKYMDRYRKEHQDNDRSEWSKEASEFCIANGLFSGGGKDANGEPNYMYEDFLTREQAMQLLFNFAKWLGKA